MADEDLEPDPTRVPLAQAIHGAQRVADEAVASWQQVSALLSPIIGQNGVKALIQRSLSLCRAEYGWLTLAVNDAPTGVPTGVPTLDEFSALHAALARQTPAVAEAGARSLLQTHVDLLGRLIGPALTSRLIGLVDPFPPTSTSTSTSTSTNTSAQDLPP